MAASLAGTRGAPRRVADELSWELLRDEWELLLAVGAGPTTVSAAAARLGEDERDVDARVRLLAEHGLLEPAADGGGGFALARAVHERKEGMASYLRDLVLKDMDLTRSPPIAGAVREGLGDAAALREILARADGELLPAVVELASRPEGDRSERFAVWFAGAAECALVADDAGEPAATFFQRLIRMLRAAAEQRSDPARAGSAKLWIAEMRVDREVADEIGDVFDRFVREIPGRTSGTGALAFAIIPTTGRARGATGA